MRIFHSCLAVTVVSACLWLPGCVFKETDFFTAPEFSDVTGGQPVYGLSVGAPCDEAKKECRPGLGCVAGACEADGSLSIGDECVMGAECQVNAFCGPEIGCVQFDENKIPEFKPNTPCVLDQQCKDLLGDDKAVCLPKPEQHCQRSGDHTEGQPCALDSDCVEGLACEYAAGFSGACAPRGTTDFGGPCAKNAECFPGLVCSEPPVDDPDAPQVCITWLQALLTSTQWPGEECDAEDHDNPRVHFEVPRADGTPKSDFYRLPYPNVLRAGHATAGHPKPGRGPLEFDPLERLLTAADTGTGGAGTSPTVIFQFSSSPDFDSVLYEGEEANLRFVNVDAASPDYRDPVGYSWTASNGRTKYICKNFMTVKSGASSPLNPGTTYAVLLLRGIKASEQKDGEGNVTHKSRDFEPDADLLALLGETKPSSPTLSSAWDAYAPLRQFLLDEDIPTAKVIGVALFKTQDPTALVRAAREVVVALPPPTVKDVVVCDGTTPSPCASADDPTRACGTDPGMIEIHGKISLPVFQQGTRPYLRTEDGGQIKMVGGKPAMEAREDVCFALTLPKTPMPETGWPIALYAHGTGGSFRSHVGDGTAKMLATLVGSEAATLGIDAPMHGPRRGDTNLEPDILYFNVANPPAARGNAIQGVIDYFALTAFVRGFSGALGTVTVDFNEAKVAFVGHSQGSTTGPLYAAFEPNVGALVFSGVGASLVNSLLRKTKPVNIPAGIKAVLREEADDSHPVLSILQAYFDSIDPANYARLITLTPPVEVTTPHPLMVVYGSGDSYTPNATTRIFADILRIPLMLPSLDTGADEAFSGYSAGNIADGPFTGNVMVNNIATTQGLCQYSPSADYDGHFVLFQNPAAKPQVAEFLRSWFVDGVATIPAR